VFGHRWNLLATTKKQTAAAGRRERQNYTRKQGKKKTKSCYRPGHAGAPRLSTIFVDKSVHNRLTNDPSREKPALRPLLIKFYANISVYKSMSYKFSHMHQTDTSRFSTNS
jgi:hypothetical protein